MSPVNSGGGAATSLPRSSTGAGAGSVTLPYLGAVYSNPGLSTCSISGSLIDLDRFDGGYTAAVGGDAAAIFVNSLSSSLIFKFII